MSIRRFIFTILLFTTSCICYGQDSSWTKQELIYYSKAKGLCTHLMTNGYDTSKRKFLFENYIEFIHKKQDTTSDRLVFFYMLVAKLYLFVDSVGLDNLDAKPLRYFKADTSFYKPYETDLNWTVDHVLVYYNKCDPNRPLGSLLFIPIPTNCFHG